MRDPQSLLGPVSPFAHVSGSPFSFDITAAIERVSRPLLGLWMSYARTWNVRLVSFVSCHRERANPSFSLWVLLCAYLRYRSHTWIVLPLRGCWDLFWASRSRMRMPETFLICVYRLVTERASTSLQFSKSSVYVPETSLSCQHRAAIEGAGWSSSTSQFPMHIPEYFFSCIGRSCRRESIRTFSFCKSNCAST